MNAYRFKATITEERQIEIPSEVPEGPVEVLVLVPDSDQLKAQTGIPLWEAVAEVMKGVPEEVIDSLPVDGAEQHDHYIYGTPKK